MDVTPLRRSVGLIWIESTGCSARQGLAKYAQSNDNEDGWRRRGLVRFLFLFSEAWVLQVRTWGIVVWLVKWLKFCLFDCGKASGLHGGTWGEYLGRDFWSHILNFYFRQVFWGVRVGLCGFLILLYFHFTFSSASFSTLLIVLHYSSQQGKFYHGICQKSRNQSKSFVDIRTQIRSSVLRRRRPKCSLPMDMDAQSPGHLFNQASAIVPCNENPVCAQAS